MGGNRDWIVDTIAHRSNRAVPYNFMFSPPARAKLVEHYGTDNLEAALDLPIRMEAPASIKPLYASPDRYGETITDEFGVVWSTSEIDRGSPIGPPLAGAADLSGYAFPDPAAANRFEHLGGWCEANKEHFTVLWVGDLWERATFMRGMENILLDVATGDVFVERLLRGIANCVAATVHILLDRFEFDAIALSDDYGTQKAMVMSPVHWRRLLRPLVAEVFAMGKACGRYTFLHSCGNIEPIIGDLIDIGLDILHPIQPEAMDVFELKRRYGRELTFCGGLRTQDLLPTGSPGQIRDEAPRLKREMGAGGGYILEPGITLQADVPLDNLIAMIGEAKETG